jgi:hypothetical protein
LNFIEQKLQLIYESDDNPPEANDSPENLNIAQKSDASDPEREMMDDKAEGKQGKTESWRTFKSP